MLSQAEESREWEDPHMTVLMPESLETLGRKNGNRHRIRMTASVVPGEL